MTTSDCWFRLPPGFFPVDSDELDDWEERLNAATELVRPDRPTAPGAAALRNLLSSLPEQGVTYAAFGLHPTEEGELLVSLLTFADVDTRAPGPAAAAARCALALAAADAGRVRERALVTLACGTPAALVTALLPAPESGGQPSGTFQARLVVARPSGAGVVVVDLTTPATELAAAYTDILLAVGQTVAFSDPDAPRAEPVSRPSRLLELQ